MYNVQPARASQSGATERREGIAVFWRVKIWKGAGGAAEPSSATVPGTRAEGPGARGSREGVQGGRYCGGWEQETVTPVHICPARSSRTELVPGTSLETPVFLQKGSFPAGSL